MSEVTTPRKTGINWQAFWRSLREAVQLLGQLFRSGDALWRYRSETAKLLSSYTVATLPVGLLTGLVMGLGVTIQGKQESSKFLTTNMLIHNLFRIAMLDVFPLVLGLILCGKIGAAIAAEIASMKVSDQLDALRAQAINPLHFLGIPRILSASVMFPVITFLATLLGMLCMYFVSVIVFGWFTVEDFQAGLRYRFDPLFFIFSLLIKPALFGFTVSFVGYAAGLSAGAGAKGVGRAATSAAVLASVLIVTLSYLLHGIGA